MKDRAPRGIVAAKEGPQRNSKPRTQLPPRGSTGNGPPCPANPEHGALYWMEGSGRWYCPHSEHMGRLSTHSEGASPPTKHFFTEEEANNSSEGGQ